MGLLRTLAYAFLGLLGELPHQQRKPHRVKLFDKPLGTFSLPKAEHVPYKGPETVRNLLTTPYVVDLPGMYYHYWVEPNPNDGYQVVTWFPEGADEVAEAKRLFRTAHGLKADGPLTSKPPTAWPPRSSEEQALIDGILADRENTRPYLAYAKFLHDRKDPYGTFIGLAIQMLKHPEGDPKHEEFSNKHFDLAQKHGHRWIRPLTSIGMFPGLAMSDAGVFAPTWYFGTKGVIEELDVREEGLFPRHAAAIFHAAPCLRKLDIQDMEATMADLAKIPQFANLETLIPNVNHGNPDDMLAFAQSPHLGRLRNLDLGWLVQNGSDAATHIAKAVWLPQLKSLNLRHWDLEDRAIQAIAHADRMNSLEELNLSNNRLHDASLQALARARSLANLKVLVVSGKLLDEYGQRVQEPWLTSTGIEALGQAVFTPGLTELELESNGLDADAARALAALPLRSLTKLHIGSNEGIGDAGFQALVAAPFLPQLESLTASSIAITDATATPLANIGFTNLKHLFLGFNQISDRGVVAIMQSRIPTRLVTLDLTSNPFGLEGVRAIAAANWPALEELKINNVPLGPAGIEALCRARFPKLKQLWVSNEHAGEDGVAALKKQFGDDRVMSY